MPPYKTEDELTPQESLRFETESVYQRNVLKGGRSEDYEWIPLFGRIFTRYNDARFIEALFFFVKSDDPVIDQKMMNAVMIKNYEMRFGLVTGLFWGALFGALPLMRGFTLATGLVWGAVPFSLAYYRSFRRGYDQISYVGSTYMELLLKKKKLLEYVGTHGGELPELKTAIMRNEQYEAWLRLFKVKPFEKD